MATPTVHILLASHNGEQFLEQQLQSIALQSHAQWTLTVSDDCSSDDTLDVVRTFASRVTQTVTILQGPGQGLVRNFFHLIANAQTTGDRDLFAFADQDDVWLENKLNTAVAWHQARANLPVRLYCGQAELVDEQLRPHGHYRRLKRPPSLGNALVENIASGHTMVMDFALQQAMRKINPAHSVWHDWTAYLLATALNGLVYFDATPQVLYRQHGGNFLGSNEGLLAHVKNVLPLLSGRYKHWVDTNLAALGEVWADLPPAQQNLVQSFENMRLSPNWSKRLKHFLQSDIRRQGTKGNLGLGLAILLKKV